MGNCCSIKSDYEESSAEPYAHLQRGGTDFSSLQNNFEPRSAFVSSPHSRFTQTPKPSYRTPAEASSRANHTPTDKPVYSTVPISRPIIQENHAEPKSVFAEPVQIQSRLDFLLKDPKPIIGESVSSLTECILSLCDDDIKNLVESRSVLHTNDRKYFTAKNLFRKTTNKHYPTKIEFIANPFLKALYLLRKQEYIILHGEENVNEELLFHGTKKENISKIIRHNFNWRFHGKARGNIFGLGMSFSPIAYYSTHYCDKEEDKVMVLALVLISKRCHGGKNMVIPPRINTKFNTRFDTSIKPDGAVVVKYCDDEFYPEYIIYFKDAQPTN